jgi:hypothetical protein
VTTEQTIFVLACLECDAGMNVETQREAELGGWSDIQLARDRNSPWTHLGACPAHKGKMDETTAEENPHV